MHRAAPWIVGLLALGLGLAWLAAGSRPEPLALPAPAPAERAPEAESQIAESHAPATERIAVASPDVLAKQGEDETKEGFPRSSSPMREYPLNRAPPIAFSGRVLDQDGKPVPGLRIDVSSGAEVPVDLTRWTYSPWQLTDAAGHFAVQGDPPAGTLCVFAHGPELVEPAGVVLDSRVDPTDGLELRVRVAPLVTGTVHWSDGAPVELFRVYARGERREVEVEGRNGRFALHLEGARLRIEVRARAYGVAGETVLEDVQPADGEVVIVLARQPRLTVHGRAVDGEGRPLAWFVLRAWKTDGRGETVLGAAREEGRFDLRGLTRGEWRVVCGAKGYLAAERTLAVHERDLEDVLFELGPQAEVTGFVLDASGAPVADASVHPAWDPSELKEAEGVETRADGAFSLAATASPLWVQAHGPDGRVGEVERIELRPGQRLDGLVLSLPGVAGVGMDPTPSAPREAGRQSSRRAGRD